MRPLDYMNLYDPQGEAIHSFVTIGFEGEGGDSSGWGQHAVICDPHDKGQYYAAWKIEMCMTLFVGSCSVESLYRV